MRPIVLRRNGIKTRHYVIDRATGLPTMNNAELTAEAVRKLAGDDFSLEDLELLACGTSSPDQNTPSHAAMVHGELGHGPCEIHSVAGVCCAGISALKYAWMSVASGQAKRAVATGSEVASSYMAARQFEEESPITEDELERKPSLALNADFLRWMLSDGAGAMLLGPDKAKEGLSLRIEWIEMFSYAHEQPACMYSGAEKLPDGRLRGWREFASPHAAAAHGAFSFRQDVDQLDANIDRLSVDLPLAEVLRRHPIRADDIAWLCPHFSSMVFEKRQYEALKRAGLAVPPERWFTNLPRVGNVGSASMFLMLEELMRSGRTRKGEKVLVFVPESGRFSAAYMLLTCV